MRCLTNAEAFGDEDVDGAHERVARGRGVDDHAQILYLGGVVGGSWRQLATRDGYELSVLPSCLVLLT